MNKTPKRFIAGAVCPKCGEMDKIVMYQQDKQTLRECVNCDYQDSLDADAVQEMPTRVSPKAKKQPAEVQELKFYRPAK